mgnify:FL=1
MPLPGTVARKATRSRQDLLQNISYNGKGNGLGSHRACKHVLSYAEGAAEGLAMTGYADNQLDALNPGPER